MKEKQILLGHGSGGKLSHELLSEVIYPAFQNEILAEKHDGAKLAIGDTRLAFTTDSFVVKPLFFPGGDIGKLAVNGTVNDLAMTGAEPLYLSAAFIIEEGFLLSDLEKITLSMQQAAKEAGVSIVTGDTKVAEKGAVDGIYINTAGIGRIIAGSNIALSRVRPGQNIIVSGYIGDHSIAVMAERHGLTLPEKIITDSAPLGELVKSMLSEVPEIPLLRDPTRGGVATTLNEIAESAGVGILLEEAALPIRREVMAVCDILGFDPLYLANEGKLLAVVDAASTDKLLAVMHQHKYGRDAKVIGRVTEDNKRKVGLCTAIGGIRLVDMLQGEQLPRIC